MDTRFTAEFWINKQGELVGCCRLPKEDTVTLEAIAEVIGKFAEKTNQSYSTVINDLRAFELLIGH